MWLTKGISYNSVESMSKRVAGMKDGEINRDQENIYPMHLENQNMNYENMVKMPMLYY